MDETKIFETLANERTRSDVTRRAQIVVDLAVMSFLIDAKVATAESAVQRIVTIQAALPEHYRTPDVGQRILAVTNWLLSRGPHPRSDWLAADGQVLPDPDPLSDDQSPQKT